MKRGKKMSSDEVVATREYVKSTYLLHPAMKANLQYIALSQDREQTDIVREALSEFIEGKGLDPYRPPRFVFGEKPLNT